MTTFTHIVFSGLMAAVTVQSSAPRIVLTGALCGALPDVDTRASLAGRILRPLSAVLEKYGHRQFTHSIVGSLVFLPVIGLVCAALDLGAGIVVEWSVMCAAFLGYVAGWLIDACTKTGVPALWPHAGRLVFPYASQYRFRTGSAAERFFCVLLLAVGAGYLYASDAAQTWDVARVFGARWVNSGDVYRQHAATHEVFARVAGHRKATNEPINWPRVRVVGVGAESELYIAPDADSVLSVGAHGQHIVTDSLAIVLGDAKPARLRSLAIPQAMRLRDALAQAKLSDAATLHGTLELDETASATLTADTPDALRWRTVEVEPTGQGLYRLHLRNALTAHLQRFEVFFVRGNITVNEQ